MGADLYITKLERQKQYRGFEVSKEAVEVGYFRDCYNDYGLFPFIKNNTKIDPSWWQLSREKKWFNKEGNMIKKGAIEFLEYITNCKLELLRRKKPYIFKSYDGTENRLMTKKEIEEYSNWLELLITFLNTATKLKSTIIWSV
jgi:hypothetical protein